MMELDVGELAASMVEPSTDGEVMGVLVVCAHACCAAPLRAASRLGISTVENRPGASLLRPSVPLDATNPGRQQSQPAARAQQQTTVSISAAEASRTSHRELESTAMTSCTGLVKAVGSKGGYEGAGGCGEDDDV